MFSVHSYVMTLVRIMLLICVGLPLVRYISCLVTRLCLQRFSKHSAQVCGKVIFYSGLAAVSVALLHECGFNVTALLGAAGIIGIAVGFASQTSVANIISGFFLLLERPFSLGDTIKTGDTVGIAESIDLLAIRVKTYDNRLVRIPNETVLKQPLINYTYYEHKRIDVLVAVPYDYSIVCAQEVILKVLKGQSLFLEFPQPSITMNKVASFDFDTQVRCFLSVRVWVASTDGSRASGALVFLLKEAFDVAHIPVAIMPII